MSGDSAADESREPLGNNVPAYPTVPEGQTCKCGCAGLSGAEASSQHIPSSAQSTQLLAPPSLLPSSKRESRKMECIVLPPLSCRLLPLRSSRPETGLFRLVTVAGLLETSKQQKQALKNCRVSCQGAVRAVSRILPRAHQPRREQGTAAQEVPLYEAIHRSVPPFQIQSCGLDGSSSDWAIVQLEEVDAGLQPCLYRCLDLSFQQEALEIFCKAVEMVASLCSTLPVGRACMPTAPGL